ncbi:hypothetical protein ATO13_22176 [Stappia sp. 22II-S9-Z10]|nr:hypothetical protein ATO13_22176 [Stappia sp. 22II-S9-Z10]
MTQPAGTCDFTWSYALDGVVIHAADYLLTLEADETHADGWVHIVTGIEVVEQRYNRETRELVDVGRVQLMLRDDPLAIFIAAHVKRAAEDVHTAKGRAVFDAAMANISDPHLIGRKRRAAA